MGHIQRGGGTAYPICLLALRKGSNPSSKWGQNPTENGSREREPDSRNASSLKDFTRDVGSSGIILDYKKGLVLTTALPFAELMQHCGSDPRKDTYQSGFDDSKDFYTHKDLADMSVCVIMQSREETKAIKNTKCSEITCQNSGVSSDSGVKTEKVSSRFHGGFLSGKWCKFGKRKDGVKYEKRHNDEFLVYDAKAVLLWRCEDFDEAMSRLLPSSEGWELDYGGKGEETGKSSHLSGNGAWTDTEEGDEERGRDEDSQRNFLSWFALVQVQGGLPAPPHQRLRYILTDHLRISQPMVACGTPFATLSPSIFYNSLSRGVVAKVTGGAEGNSSLVLTDARCMPGTEGGGLFVMSEGQRHLAAMIVSPLCWKANEWIGLTLSCSIQSILTSLHQLTSSDLFMLSSLTPNSDVTPSHKALKTLPPMFHSVVLLRVGSVWGSGVIVDAAQGLILTCRHVVKNAFSQRVNVKAYSLSWMKAAVVYRTSPQSPFDLALVKIEEQHDTSHLIQAELSHRCHEGSSVYAVGYPLFDPSHTTTPSVTSGVVSKVKQVNRKPVMIQSSCAVHAGVSGGALMCSKTGQLLGIIASNSRDTERGASFPHINFSIPAEVFRSSLQEYARTKDASCLQTLDSADRRITKIWALEETGVYRTAPQSKL